MTIAGLFAGLRSSRRHSTPLEATPNTTRITMKPRESTPAHSSSNDLLIRRSWVRNPPGSYTYKRLRSTLAGLFAGRPAPKASPEQLAQILRLHQAELDRELTIINICLRSGTTRLLG